MLWVVTHTATLNLTINNSSSSSEDATACDSFDWNGVTYTESGTYTFESTNESGCAYTATLNLTINSSSQISEDVYSRNKLFLERYNIHRKWNLYK